MGHGQYLVYSSKSSIFQECIILSFFRFWEYSKCLFFFEESIIVSQAPALFPKIKMSRILLSITLNFSCYKLVTLCMIYLNLDILWYTMSTDSWYSEQFFQWHLSSTRLSAAAQAHHFLFQLQSNLWRWINGSMLNLVGDLIWWWGTPLKWLVNNGLMVDNAG